MKHLSLTVLFALVSTALLAQSNPESWVGTLDLHYKGHQVNEEQLTHEAFCLDNRDTLTIVYDSGTPTEDQFVILGAEIWGQVSLGEPSLLAQVPAGQPGNHSQLVVPLASYVPAHLLPADGKAVRVMLRVRRIIKVEGQRYLAHYDVPGEEDDFSFLLTRNCK